MASQPERLQLLKDKTKSLMKNSIKPKQIRYLHQFKCDHCSQSIFVPSNSKNRQPVLENKRHQGLLEKENASYHCGYYVHVNVWVKSNPLEAK